MRQIVKPALVETFFQIKTEAPNAAVFAVGYPLLIGGDPCLEAPRFDAGEIADLRVAAGLLNQVIAEAAAIAGVFFVPVAQEFRDHEVCAAGDSWMNPIRILTRNREYGLHPNLEGHLAYARLISQSLENKGIAHPSGFFDSGLPKNP